MASVGEQRFSELVRRALALRESTALHPIEDLLPVLPVVNPGDIEQYLLRRDKAFVCGLGVGAFAAQFGVAEIFNPIGSGAIIIVDAMEPIATLGLMRVRWQNQTGQNTLANLAAQTAKVADGRNGGSPFTRGVASLRAGTVAATIGSGGVCQSQCVNGESARRVVGIVLAPGQAFAVENGNANTELACNVWYRERAIDPSEMNPGG